MLKGIDLSIPMGKEVEKRGSVLACARPPTCSFLRRTTSRAPIPAPIITAHNLPDALRNITREINVYQGRESLPPRSKNSLALHSRTEWTGRNQNLRDKLLSALPPLPLRCHRRDTAPRCHGAHYDGSFRRLT